MNIWLIKTGEVLPIDGEHPRLYRMGLLADLLVKQGHRVLWWTSDFDHFQRKHRFKKNKIIDLNDHYRMVLIKSCGYTKNVSFKRLFDHYQIAAKFQKMASTYESPDLILCSMPTIELAAATVKYGSLNNVPVVLDLRDLWPDVFLRAFPKEMKRLSKILMWPYYRQLKHAILSSTAITGITQQILDWGLTLADREPATYDEPFYLAYHKTKYGESSHAQDFWQKYGIRPGMKKKVISFVGSINRQFDFDTVIQAARLLQDKTDYYFVMCGSGEFLENLREKSADCHNIVFPGHINGSQIQYLLKNSYLGIAPYYPTKDFLMSLPNKIGEYLSENLPVVVGMNGVTGNLLKKHECGVVYESGKVQSLYTILLDLFENLQNVAKMSEQAKALFQTELAADIVYPKMINWLLRIAKEHKENNKR